MIFGMKRPQNMSIHQKSPFQKFDLKTILSLLLYTKEKVKKRKRKSSETIFSCKFKGQFKYFKLKECFSRLSLSFAIWRIICFIMKVTSYQNNSYNCLTYCTIFQAYFGYIFKLGLPFYLLCACKIDFWHFQFFYLKKNIKIKTTLKLKCKFYPLYLEKFEIFCIKSIKKIKFCYIGSIKI